MGDVEVYFRHLNRATEEQIAQYKVASDIIPRPGFNTAGKEISMGVNAYPISQYPTKAVYQYDVSSFTKIMKQAGQYINSLLRFLLEMVSRNAPSSKRCGTRRPERRKSGPNSFSTATSLPGEHRINSLAMVTFANIHRSMADLKDEINIIVDLDAEQGRAKSDGSNSFRFVMRQTKKVNLAVVDAYAKGKVQFSKDVLEGLSKSA